MITLFRLAFVILASGLVTGATALVLRFMAPRHHRLGGLLWPLTALLVWTGACLFLAIAFATDPDNVTSEAAMRGLLRPLAVLIIGDALGLIWLWSTIRRYRGGLDQPRVAA